MAFSQHFASLAVLALAMEQWAVGISLLRVLIVWTLPAHVVFVAASLEEMTTGKESQQDYYYEQGDRWEDGHRKSLRTRLAISPPG